MEFELSESEFNALVPEYLEPDDKFLNAFHLKEDDGNEWIILVFNEDGKLRFQTFDLYTHCDECVSQGFTESPYENFTECMLFAKQFEMQKCVAFLEKINGGE